MRQDKIKKLKKPRLSIAENSYWQTVEKQKIFYCNYLLKFMRFSEEPICLSIVGSLSFQKSDLTKLRHG